MRGGGDEGGWGVGVSLPANPHHSAGRWTTKSLDSFVRSYD